MQLLLDAGADSTIPAGTKSPLNLAIRNNHHNVAALLRRAIAEPDRARCLHKARSVLDADTAIDKVWIDSRDDGDTPVVQKQKTTAAATSYLKRRVEQDQPLPRPELAQGQGDQQVRATVAFVLGSEEGGVEYVGLPYEMYVDLLGYLLPGWADKGPENEA